VETFDVQNPITGEILYTIEGPSDDQIDAAYEKAAEVQKYVGSLSVNERVKEVLKLSDWILANYDHVMDKLIEETGKARFDAFTSEIFAVLDAIDYYKGHAKKILADKKVHTPIFQLGKKSRIYYEPLGTVLVITPWNYPFFQGIVPSILAFLAGNAVIIKPSELTPLKGLWEKMIADSGFLPGAFQFVYGGRETGGRLIDQRPDKIHFTGSVRAGKAIMAKAAEQLIPTDLELGGKDPAIVFDDVNIERTVNGIMWGALTTAGQSCTSIERLYVQETIYDDLVDMLVDRTKKLRLSMPNRDTSQPDDCDIGTVTSPAQVAIIESHIEEALEKGATLLCGGVIEKGSHHMVPTIVADVDHSMKIASEETFGPVIAVMKFKTEDEAIELANDSPYGLSASVWSADLKRADRVARAIKTGNVSINNHMLTEANAALPFGGVKDSGIGRFKGDEGLTTFCNSKSVLVDKQSENIDPHWYPFTNSKFQMLAELSESYFRRRKKWIKFAKNGLKADSIGKKEKIK
jgi:acyl-CoA reductase-like NAD-dependent aldehyde dehydrogenase